MEPELKPGNIKNTRGASELLISVALEAVEALNAVQPKDKRLQILQPATLRAARIACAALLLDQNGFVEEVLALSRTLAEIVITACYLQIASEQELEAFYSFDTQWVYKSSETLEQFIDPDERISEEHRNELKANRGDSSGIQLALVSCRIKRLEPDRKAVG